jgi:hypothetical protein
MNSFSLARLTLIGRLSHAPKVGVDKNGKDYTMFKVATNQVSGQGDGE